MAPSHHTTVHPPAGFHPVLTTELSQLRPLGPSCSLHLLYALGSDVILDQYQIRQLHSEGHLVYSKRSFEDEVGGEKSKGKGKSIQAELYLGGQLDLEAPVSQVDPKQQAYALISLPIASSQNLPPGYEVPPVDVTVEMPLHVRYQEPVLSRYLSKQGREGYGGRWYIKHSVPQDRNDTVSVAIDWPCVFWACNSEQPEASEASSPYKIMDYSSSCIGQLPQDLRSSLPTFSPAHPQTTNPYHYLLPFKSSSESSHSPLGSSRVTVPTGVLGDLSFVTLANVVVTWLAFLILAKKGFDKARSMRRQEKVERVQVETEEKQKKTT
ncbi:hypothetical protein P389DRAFT_102282 [Cystobasidium minutum MCA 4210]|uniref:uncharacterized protein n=1 Tax=Cystobasidium minutum MCA 4210 TaxID=1397322 RepID=UPI0034CD7D8A|eukprot:jgi/Rhomi1/102282/CE102281_2533